VVFWLATAGLPAQNGGVLREAAGQHLEQIITSAGSRLPPISRRGKRVHRLDRLEFRHDGEEVAVAHDF
jgi:hypothetical protein